MFCSWFNTSWLNLNVKSLFSIHCYVCKKYEEVVLFWIEASCPGAPTTYSKKNASLSALLLHWWVDKGQMLQKYKRLVKNLQTWVLGGGWGVRKIGCIRERGLVLSIVEGGLLCQVTGSIEYKYDKNTTFLKKLRARPQMFWPPWHDIFWCWVQSFKSHICHD